MGGLRGWGPWKCWGSKAFALRAMACPKIQGKISMRKRDSGKF